MLDLESFVFDKEMDPVQIAIMLAMTRNQEEEKEMLRRYRGMGARCAVTMVSGSNAADRNKTLRSVVGLCLNERIVEKKTEHLHPVAHATWVCHLPLRQHGDARAHRPQNRRRWPDDHSRVKTGLPPCKRRT